MGWFVLNKLDILIFSFFFFSLLLHMLRWWEYTDKATPSRHIRWCEMFTFFIFAFFGLYSVVYSV